MISKIGILLFLILLISNNLLSQNLKYLFFDYKLDSSKSRMIHVSMPSNGQTAALSNCIVSDYVGNTRFTFNTSIITSKNDTFLAIHSLFNGIGNFTFESEKPIYYKPIKPLDNFIGATINPRVSTILNSNNMIEKSTLNLDIGLNAFLKVQGELGNLSAKFILRNAIIIGNNQFVEKVYNTNSKIFYYSSFQIKIKTNINVFNINIPIILVPINSKEILGFPLYAGLGYTF